MAKDDMHVVIYKILTYLYQCIKDGVNPNANQAQKLCDINPVYWNAIVEDCVDRGFIKTPCQTASSQSLRRWRITFSGVEYLEESSSMNKIKHAIGESFEIALRNAIEITKMC